MGATKMVLNTGGDFKKKFLQCWLATIQYLMGSNNYWALRCPLYKQCMLLINLEATSRVFSNSREKVHGNVENRTQGR